MFDLKKERKFLETFFKLGKEMQSEKLVGRKLVEIRDEEFVAPF